MTKVRIYQPCKSAMQSGQNNSHKWILQYPNKDLVIDDIMGWTGSSDMRHQEVRLKFATCEQAIQYATDHQLNYEVIYSEQQHAEQPILRPYTDNFK